MTNVIQFRRRKPEISDNAAALQEMMTLEERGELGGTLNIFEAPGGNVMSVTGRFSDRLQYSVHALVKMISILVDQIDTDETAGHTYSPAIRRAVERPRGAPLRLREDSRLGGL